MPNIDTPQPKSFQIHLQGVSFIVPCLFIAKKKGNALVLGMAIQVMEFQVWGYKIERFLPKNQHAQRKLLNFENWCSRELSKLGIILIIKWSLLGKNLSNFVCPILILLNRSHSRYIYRVCHSQCLVYSQQRKREMHQCWVWQFRLWSFKSEDTKLDFFS